IRESRAQESTIQAFSTADSTFRSLFREEQQLKIDRVFYERKLAEARQQQDTLKQASIETTLAGIYEQLQILQRHFETDYPAYHEVNFRMDLATIEKVQAELLGAQSDRALIEYHLGETAIYVMRITANEARFFRLAYPADFEPLIQQYRLAISTNQMPEVTRFRQYTHAAHQLYQSLMAPVLADIPPGIRQLYLIPDGQLGFISFESLLTAAPASEAINYSLGALDYLIESWRVSYGYSGSLLLENKRYRQGARPRRPYAGFAPVFDELANPIASERNCEDGNPLGALLHSETSVRELQQLLGGKYYLRAQASKANFLAAAADYQILHLSTHACVDELDPQFNRIFFADDFLPTYEIYNLRLNADLVVLSACETGYGELVKGEGIMSL
ncbi:MAG: CHAT domain-containing protein, partial [Phaeodactylibacter sp.]|nr:CHAT domain-containing protein [Phaeodactylibacter sp.]